MMTKDERQQTNTSALSDDDDDDDHNKIYTVANLIIRDHDLFVIRLRHNRFDN